MARLNFTQLNSTPLNSPELNYTLTTHQVVGKPLSLPRRCRPLWSHACSMNTNSFRYKMQVTKNESISNVNNLWIAEGYSNRVYVVCPPHAQSCDRWRRRRLTARSLASKMLYLLMNTLLDGCCVANCDNKVLRDARGLSYCEYWWMRYARR